jgi:hypothetical protein
MIPIKIPVKTLVSTTSILKYVKITPDEMKSHAIPDKEKRLLEE